MQKNYKANSRKTFTTCPKLSAQMLPEFREFSTVSSVQLRIRDNTPCVCEEFKIHVSGQNNPTLWQKQTSLNHSTLQNY